MIPVGGRSNQCFCSYCKREITFQFRSHCVECENYNLCSDCFCIGASLYPHDSSHSYNIIECLDLPCFVKEWSYNEEILLVEAIQKYGLGNWKVVADYMAGVVIVPGSKGDVQPGKEGKDSSHRSAKEIESHYWDVYVRNGYTRSLVKDQVDECINSTASDMNSNVSSIASAATSSDILPKEITCGCFIPERVCVLNNVYNTSSGVGSVTSVPISELNYTGSTPVITADMLQKHHLSTVCGCVVHKHSQWTYTPATSSKPIHMLNTRRCTTDVMTLNPGINRDTLLPGYMPLRCDFDLEYENDAELLLSDMDFANDIVIERVNSTNVGTDVDTVSSATVEQGRYHQYTYTSKYEHPSEIQLKLQVIDIYNQKLTEREKRKKFVVETGLVDIKRQQQLERKVTSGAILCDSDVSALSSDDCKISHAQLEKELVSKLRVFSRFSERYQPSVDTNDMDNTDASPATSTTSLSVSPVKLIKLESDSRASSTNGIAMTPTPTSVSATAAATSSEYTHSSTTHAMLIESLLKIRKLKKQIDVLHHYRKLNITSLDDPKLLDLEKKRKQCKESGSGHGLEFIDEGANMKRICSEASVQSTASSISSLGGKVERKSSSRNSVSASTTFQPVPVALTNVPSADVVTGASKRANSRSTTPAATAAPAHSPLNTPVIMTAAIQKDPNFVKLTALEKQLCGAVNILPSQYITLQTALSKEVLNSKMFEYSQATGEIKRLYQSIAIQQSSGQVQSHQIQLLADFFIPQQK